MASISLLNVSAKFKTDAPLLVIDCSYQNETFKNGTVDARIEFETLADAFKYFSFLFSLIRTVRELRTFNW
jgi:hypothetical protein